MERGGKEGKKKEKDGKKRKEKRRGVRSSNFSLEFVVIGLSVLVGARSKVGPRNESYAWVPKSVGFVKLREVGVFLQLDFILGLRAIQIALDVGAGNDCAIQSRNFGTKCWNFQDCLGQSGAGFLGLFWTIQKLHFQDCFGQSGIEFWDCLRTVRN